MAIAWDGAAWQPTTPYAVSARVVNGGNVYQCVGAGTSAGSGGPTGTGAGIVDGGVTWNYLGPFTGAVLDVAPELATGSPVIAPEAQSTLLALAEQLVASLDIWGTLLDDGRRYLAAHLAELSRLRGRGPITAESVGPLSRSYATLMGTRSLQLTPAGRMYLDLIRTTKAVFGFTA